MKKFLIFLMFFALEAKAQQLTAPLIQWQIVSNDIPSLQKVVEAENGHYVFAGNATFGEVYLSEMDSSGYIFWQKCLDLSSLDTNVELSDFKKISNGYVILETIDVVIDSVNFKECIRIIKTDVFGNVVWNKIYFDSINDYYGFSIKETIDKKFIVSGTNYLPQHNQKPFLILIDSLGGLQWFKDYFINNSPDHNYNYGKKVVSFDNGFGFLVESYLNDWQGSSFTFLKVDQNGDSISSFNPVLTEVEDFFDFALSNQDQSLLFVKQNGDTNSIIKTNQNGNIISQKDFNFNLTFYLSEIVSKLDSGFLIINQGSTDTCGINNCPWTTYYLIKMIRILESGDTLWTKKIGGNFGHSIVFSSIYQTSDGGYVVSAMENDSIFGSEYHLLVLKLRKEQSISDVQSTVKEEIKVFPNPTTDVLNIEINNWVKDEELNFSLFNLFGELVYKKEIFSSFDVFDIEFLPAGYYVYKITRENGVGYAGKIIKY